MNRPTAAAPADVTTGHASHAAEAHTLQWWGRGFLTAFYAAAQALKLYPLENTMVQKALAELHRVAGGLLEEEGILELRLAGDFLFLNDVRLRLDFSNYVAFSFLAGALTRHGVGTLEVEKAVTVGEWVPFLALLAREPASENAYEQFAARIASSPVSHVRIAPKQTQVPDVDQPDEERRAAHRTYTQSVQVAREVLTDVRLGRAINVRRVKRAVQSIVDQVLTNETTIVGMTTLRDFDEYTFTHSVNVCIFSVVLGQKLGLDKLQLYELGLAGLFHDIGKMRLSQEVVNKVSVLSDPEWAEVQEHPTEGLLSLFGMHGFSDVPYRAMLVAYEHHMKVDLSGYPRSVRPRQPTLYSRIVAVADGFDAATSRRSYQNLPWRPEDVFTEMRDNPTRGYDPLLVKAFINVTGIYPAGTLVILDTYELAVVVAPNPDRTRLHQPMVKLIADPLGLPLATPRQVDLSELNPETGYPRRSVIKTADPEKYGVRVADYVP
jgi:HD-GYP domain-containing protein (c-di-GMP phosphodiesterase class II)